LCAASFCWGVTHGAFRIRNVGPALRDVASFSTSPEAICFFGQPSARASGSHIAITRGVRASDGLSRAMQPLSAS
jgi:hypothetical protein